MPRKRSSGKADGAELPKGLSGVRRGKRAVRSAAKALQDDFEDSAGGSTFCTHRCSNHHSDASR